jgi:hypothetical protein
MNYLYRQYGNSTVNEEMVHDLVMFLHELQREIEKYEWWPMMGLEKDASYIYWKEIGSQIRASKTYQLR